MTHKVIFTADLAGDMKQYEALFSLAHDTNADSVILGGDLAPGIEDQNGIINQRRFFTQELFPLARQFKSSHPNTNLYAIMGNDDCAANVNILASNDSPLIYIHGKRVPFASGFELYGYSYVPLTPFGLKDWEKFDAVPKEGPKRTGFKRFFGSGSSTEQAYNPNALLEGLTTTSGDWKKKTFDPAEIKDTIEADLNDKGLTTNPSKTIYVFHSPPHNTNLDMLKSGQHVGSKAIRNFIDYDRPYATLHGHIHETVQVSGKFQDQIRDTLCLTAGNGVPVDQWNPAHLAALTFDLEDVANTVERKVLKL